MAQVSRNSRNWVGLSNEMLVMKIQIKQANQNEGLFLLWRNHYFLCMNELKNWKNDQ